MKTNELENRIVQIESREEINAKTISGMISRLEFQMQCSVKDGHHFTLSWERYGNFHFRCINCDLEYSKTKENLTEKEKKLVEAVLSNQNGKVENEDTEICS